MQTTVNIPLAVGALLSAVAALLHLGIIAGGPAWYRFFGAGERFARAAAEGRWYPTVVTLGIAAVLFIWSAYALAGAGVVTRLPLLKAALVGITAVYLVRGIAFAPLVVAKGGAITPFVVWSSLICFGYGVVHLVGLVQRWTAL
ncbi:hypothetical protein NX786_09240 [Telluria mixta]|uniref:Uncharacterized protein n=1 Tax=Telluria mixta TaxID=34071 RepID=A0ABT2BWK1_9BURK|nr:hypothetical protein [Telluria mixta]MCS0629517.1 hypothetical protein [Telluria mixta]WEM96908.1 hypothetical protein P0M04_03970 [Telluria mixta]